jgi:Glycine/serine hydroxymethyltransferase
MTCNKNGVPYDPEKPTVTSGIRLGTPAGTTRGFRVQEFVQVADWVNEVLTGLQEHGAEGNGNVESKVKAEIKEFCGRFPIYQG